MTAWPSTKVDEFNARKIELKVKRERFAWKILHWRETIDEASSSSVPAKTWNTRITLKSGFSILELKKHERRMRVKKREYKVPSIFQPFTVRPQIAPNSLFSPHSKRLSSIIFIFFHPCARAVRKRKGRQCLCTGTFQWTVFLENWIGSGETYVVIFYFKFKSSLHYKTAISLTNHYYQWLYYYTISLLGYTQNMH